MRVVPVVLVFAATLAIVFLIGWVIDRRRQAFVASQGEDGERVTEPSLAFPQTRLHLPWLKALTEKTGLARPLELKLNRAAIPLRPVEFVALTYFLTAVFFSAGAFLIREFWAVALLGWVGYRAPTWLLNFLAARRKALLERQLAPSLRLIAACLRAGNSLQQGFHAVGHQMPPPIAEEFQRVERLVHRGIAAEDALRVMGQRIGSYDFDIFIKATTIHLHTGGRLADLLESIARTIRERITLQREIAAAAAQGKMSGAILLLLPLGIAVALFFINPQYGRLLTQTPLGRGLVKVAVTMQVVGALMVRRMLRLRV